MAFCVLVAETFERITASGAADPREMAQGLGNAGVPFVVAGTVGTVGLIAAFVAALKGYRARWFFRWSLALAIVHLTFVPIGTVLGAAWLAYLLRKRAEFAPSAEARAGNSPWASIWFHPRFTIRALTARGPVLYVLLLAAIGGIDDVLDRLSSRSLGDTWQLRELLFAALLIGPSYGMAVLYGWSWSLGVTGRLLGGRATFANIRAATAWSAVPVVLVSLPLWLVDLVVVGEEMFTTVTPRLDASLALTVYALASFVLAAIAVIWSIVLLVACLSEVQAYSIWRALANAVLATLAFGLVIVAAVGVALLVG